MYTYIYTHGFWVSLAAPWAIQWGTTGSKRYAYQRFSVTTWCVPGTSLDVLVSNV